MTTETQQHFLNKLLLNNNIKNILDIGANVGTFSNLCKSIVQDSTIYMIEANPQCEQFLKNIGNKYYIAALSDENKEVTFYININNPVCTGASYYKENGLAYIGANEIKLKTSLLDELLSDEDIVFDFIKVDVQGSELDVIRGGKKIISEASFVLCECPYTEIDSTLEYNSGGCNFKQIVDEMKKCGFLKYEIVEELRVQSTCSNWQTGTLVAIDVLFYK